MAQLIKMWIYIPEWLVRLSLYTVCVFAVYSAIIVIGSAYYYFIYSPKLGIK